MDGDPARVPPCPGVDSLSALRLIFAAGVLALGTGLLHFALGPIEKPPTLEEVVADKTVKLRDAVLRKLKNQEAPAPPDEESRWGPDRIVISGSMMAGFIAATLGLLAFIKREDTRISAGAALTGAAAIALQLLIALTGALILLALIIAVLGALSGS